MRESPDPESLVESVLAGVSAAWQDLWRLLEPKLYESLRRPGRLGRLARSEDDCRNIALEVVAALQENDHSRLRHFALAKRDNPALSFWAWLDVVARRLAIDYMRRQKDFIDRRREENASQTGAWQQILSVGSDSRLPGVRPPLTDVGTAHELLAYAGNQLSRRQFAALRGWMAGRSFEEIAADLSLKGARDAERTLRAGLERMRRHFRLKDAT